MQERADDGGIDAPGQPEQHAARAHLLAHRCDAVGDDVPRRPQPLAAADFAHEALQYPRALPRVRHLRMELHAVEPALLVRHARQGRILRAGDDLESRRQRVNAIAMAHPHVEEGLAVGIDLVLDVAQQGRMAAHAHLRVAEFACVRRRHPPAELCRHRLHAVADAEHGHTQLEHRRVRARRRGISDGFRSARQDDPARPKARTSASLKSHGCSSQ